MADKNPLLKVQDYGQSIWLDFIRRGMLETGELSALINDDGIRGVTVNPSILDKAIRTTDDYATAIDKLNSLGTPPHEIYEALAIEDVQQAADLFRPRYEQTEGRHGFVSLEVSPRLAYDTERTIERVHYLWKKLNRPNVMIKVPGTEEGLPAIRRLTESGVNVNVTLLFGLPRYRKVAEAYISGIEARLSAGKTVNHVASVASFFLSRINVLVDPLLEEIMEEGGPRAEKAERIHGEVASASAKLAYQIYQHIFEGERFEHARAAGARVQRLLWASTSTKNPEYSDIKYVEPLIGPQTVNTMPLRTIDAYRDHGNPAPRLEEEVEKAQKTLTILEDLGLDIDEVTQQLEDEGVEKFVNAYNQLLDALEERSTKP